MCSESWTIRLPFARPPLSLNSRGHWSARYKITREIRVATYYLALAASIPACERVRVTLHWVPKDARKRDSDNPFPTIKACIDGLRDAQIVPDDDSTHVESACVIDPPDPSDPHIYLTIERLG